MTYVQDKDEDYDDRSYGSQRKRQFLLFVRDRRRARADTLDAMWKEWADTRNGIEGDVPPLFRLLENPNGTGMCSVVQTRDGLSVVFEWAFNDRSLYAPFTVAREGVSPHHEDEVVWEIERSLANPRKRGEKKSPNEKKSPHLYVGGNTAAEPAWSSLTWSNNSTSTNRLRVNAPTPRPNRPSYRYTANGERVGGWDELMNPDPTPIYHEPLYERVEVEYPTQPARDVEPTSVQGAAETFSTLRDNIDRLTTRLRELDAENNEN